MNFIRCTVKRIAVCDGQIEKQLQQYEASRNEGEIQPLAPQQKAASANPVKKKHSNKNTSNL